MQVSVPGAELSVLTRGSGPVCLVPCNMGTKPFERQIPSALDADFTLAFVDLRGSGQSTGVPAELTFDVLADDLEAIRHSLGVEHVCVFGHSILGALAVEYGRRCPAQVSHVITAGTPPHADMQRLAAAGRALFERTASEDRKRVLAENLARIAKNPEARTLGQLMLAQTPQRFFNPRYDAAPLYADATLSPELFAHLLGVLTAGWDIEQGTPPFDVPHFIALGRHDYVVPPDSWQGALGSFPRATLQVFEESGHQPFLEEPERFCAALRAWLRSC